MRGKFSPVLSRAWPVGFLSDGPLQRGTDFLAELRQLMSIVGSSECGFDASANRCLSIRVPFCPPASSTTNDTALVSPEACQRQPPQDRSIPHGLHRGESPLAAVPWLPVTAAFHWSPPFTAETHGHPLQHPPATVHRYLMQHPPAAPGRCGRVRWSAAKGLFPLEQAARDMAMAPSMGYRRNPLQIRNPFDPPQAPSASVLQNGDGGAVLLTVGPLGHCFLAVEPLAHSRCTTRGTPSLALHSSAQALASRDGQQEPRDQESGQKLLDEGSGPQPQPRQRQFRSGPVTWGSLALLVATGAGLLYYFEQEKQKRLASLRKVKSVGKAAIGGPLRLVNDEGKPVTQEDLKGKWNLLYFGFTYCPDICPAELEKMAQAIDILEKKHKLKVQPVFISIDPERDTPEQVKAYVKEFHPGMVGLTGSVQAVKDVAREFRVYYMKTEEEGDDYLVDHSIIMYLMDPSWEFVKFFGRNHTSESLADGIAVEMGSTANT